MRILPAIFLAACISDATQIPIKCGPTDPCPEGQQCGAAGLCVTPDQPAMDDMAMSSDAASNVDQAMMPGSGCTRGTATNLGRAWACRTMYNKTTMTASSACSQGFHVCRDSTDIGAASLTACGNLDGFYAASYIGSRNEFQMPGAATCGQGELYKVIFGCGKGGVAAATSCVGLSRVIDCASSTTSYTCAGVIDGVDGRAATDGVLCCPN